MKKNILKNITLYSGDIVIFTDKTKEDLLINGKCYAGLTADKLEKCMGEIEYIIRDISAFSCIPMIKVYDKHLI